PNIPEFDRVAVVLKQDGASLAFGNVDASRGDGDFSIVDRCDSVLNHGDFGFLLYPAVHHHSFVEGHIVRLPLQRWLASVHSRYNLAVDGAAFVVLWLESVRVEDLQLVGSIQVDAAVSASLAVRTRHVRHVEFEMELIIAKPLLSHDIAA